MHVYLLPGIFPRPIGGELLFTAVSSSSLLIVELSISGESKNPPAPIHVRSILARSEPNIRIALDAGPEDKTRTPIHAHVRDVAGVVEINADETRGGSRAKSRQILIFRREIAEAKGQYRPSERERESDGARRGGRHAPSNPIYEAN